jgi:hypothetical protein
MEAGGRHYKNEARKPEIPGKLAERPLNYKFLINMV